ncbi:MAG TPA: Maf-like protein [Candidatus Copromorpha excrementigallinarum]|uniref:Nucleoside triphosphate pyrophosphatase n=1 Tax=Candidatus Allocopromorpha excrementigallinarum TaxID=2840742 RepID=A0A9D1HZH0_9FIRM|nr:Maf-like protein [Candidatus Copromorpha excrementigallinarum]
MMKEKGYHPAVIPSQADETLPFSMSPEGAAMYTALKKAFDVYERLEEKKDCLIIAADTVVYLDRIIGKPKNPREAFETLSAMRERTHQVITGVCVIDTSASLKRCFYSVSGVSFGYYSDEELKAYVNTPEPYDKAGGYAVQGTFGRYVEKIEGDVNNVIGFPWDMIEPFLRSFPGSV